jgi:alpha-beta hydrolase superfamily lysophospholipase
VPFYPLARILISDEYASEAVLSEIKTPTLVMHSPHDQVVDFKGGRELYQKLSAPKWWWKIQEGQHADAFHVSDGKYRKKFLELIDQKIRVKSSH